MSLKVVVAIVVVILLLPVIAALWPKPLTFERIRDGFEGKGLVVEQYTPVEPPALQAVEQVYMNVAGARVDVYRYDDRGKIAKQLEYQKPDAGTVIVESWNLAQSLGAAQPKKIPTAVGRNGMFMLVVMGDSQELCNRILRAFKEV